MIVDPLLDEALTAFYLGESSQPEIIIDPKLQAEFEAEACRKSFRLFAGMMHNAKYPGIPWNEAELHRRIFKFLERAYTEPGFAGVINIPPRAGKTELVCMWVAWCFGHHPDSLFIYATSTQTLSEKSAMLIKDIMNHPFFLKVFPKCRINPKVNARDLTQTTQSGQLLARGTEGQITGEGAGHKLLDAEDGSEIPYRFGGALIFDDLHKIAEARSPVMQEHVANFAKETLFTRLNHVMKTPIIGIGQRCAMKDIFGHITPPEGSDIQSITSRKFEVLEIPALQVDADGNEFSIWPANWPLEWLRGERKAKPWTFETQYQQKPYNEMGEMFDVDMMPVLHARPGGPRVVVRSWDLAARKLKAGRTEPDFTAKPLLAYYYDSKQYVIEDAQLYRAKPQDIRKDMLHTANRDGRETYITIPQEPGQAGVDQVTTLVELLDGYKVKPMSTSRGDKVTRAEPFAAQLNQGRVSVLFHIADLVKRELKPFPDAPHDDLVDALSDGYAFLAIPEDEDEMSKRRAIANLEQAGKFVIGEGLTRSRNPDAEAEALEGYLPGEGEV